MRVNLFSLAGLFGLVSCQTIISQLHNQTNANFNSTPAFNASLLAALNATKHASFSASNCDSCYAILKTLKSVAELWIYTKTMPRDPSGIFAFIVSQLQIAEDNGERAWIIGHIPPGRSDALYDYSSYLDQIVQRYDATIAAMFWGHTHRDQFEISYSDYHNQTADNAKMVGYIAPSLTPTSGNPNFRAYSIDPVTFGVLDYTVYYSNLSAPVYHTTGPQWSKYYSAKAAYGSMLTPRYTDPKAELTPAFWHNVTDLFANNDTIFQEYVDRKQRGWDYTPCEGTCKSNEICQLRSAQSQYGCLSPSPAMKKRDVNGFELTARVESECSGSRMVEVLHEMAGDLVGVEKWRSEREA